MKKMLLTLILLARFTFACEFDTDCQPGSSCVKHDSSIYGVCMGGINPGNDNDEQPVYSPTDINGTYGNTCEFDTDCGPRSTCEKEYGQINGVCINNND